MHIMYSKKEPHIEIKSHHVRLFSGHLNYTNSFEPKLFKGSLADKALSWLYDCELLKVKLSEVNTYSKSVYCWLYQKDLGEVFKVWGLDNHEPNTSKLLPNNKVMINGLGVFDYEDFQIFEF